MTIILDARALIAVERADRDVIAMLKAERRAGRAPITHGGVVGQVWRGGARQARLARLLDAVAIVALDDTLGRRAGALLGRCRKGDVVDAALVSLAVDGDVILTSVTRDLDPLARAAGTHLELVDV